MSQIISVHSYRGGTGKTNLTGNIAANIASYGKRVAVVDGDIQSPGIHVLFGMDDEEIKLTLNDYLWGRCDIKETVYEVSHRLRFASSSIESLRSKSGHLYLIPSSISTDDITRIVREGYDADLLTEGFTNLMANLELDYLFIDTHPGISGDTLLSIAVSHILVIVMRPDYQDYQGTAVAVDLAQQLEVPKTLLLINKALHFFNLEDLRQQVEDAYKVSVIGVLPLNEEVAHLASSDLFGQRYPEHPWSEEVNTVSKRLMSIVP